MFLHELIRNKTRPMHTIPSGAVQMGSPRSTIRAILFDVYGTLFISDAGDIGVAMQESERSMLQITEILTRHHIKDDPSVFLSRFFAAIERKKAEMTAAGIDYPEVDIEKIWQEITGFKDRHVIQQFAVDYELAVNPVYPMPHARELLSLCKGKGIPMGIISNAQFYTPHLFPALMGASLPDLGFSEELLFFSYVLRYCKPSLHVFEKAAAAVERIGVSVKNTVYIGNDMVKDIYPAHKTGFQTALFAGDKRSLNMREDDPRVQGISPDMVITDFLQVVHYLDF